MNVNTKDDLDHPAETEHLLKNLPPALVAKTDIKERKLICCFIISSIASFAIFKKSSLLKHVFLFDHLFITDSGQTYIFLAVFCK